MKNIMFPAIAVMTVAALSCSSLRPEHKESRQAVIIRCMSIKAVYEVVSSRSETAVGLKKEREDLHSRIRGIELKLLSGEEDRKKLMQELQSLMDASEELERKETAYKEETLKIINTAVEELAGKIGADFILNKGDGVVYSRDKYDITEDVIREVIRQEQRRNPVVR